MPIPEFDEQTGYLPPGDHFASLDEMEERFCWTYRRREIFKGLRRVIEQLEANGVETVWIDGSFVTDRDRPGDVDVIYVPPPGANPDRWGLLSPGRRRDLKQTWKVDLLKFQPPKRAGGALRSQTIKDFFSTDRDGVPKGLIQLSKGVKDDQE